MKGFDRSEGDLTVGAWLDIHDVDFADVLRRRDEWEELILTAYDAADPKDRRRVELVVYRCRPARCELLTAWQSPRGPRIRPTGYKTSPEVASKLADQKRRRPPRAVSFDDIPGNAQLRLYCDHVSTSVTKTDLLADAERARPGAPVRRLLS